MKKMHTAVHTVKKGFIYVMVFCLVLLNTVPATVIAQGAKGEKPVLVIKYLGMMQDKLLFQLEFENKDGHNFSLRIKDEQGNLFYKEEYKTKNFSKKFIFSKEEFGDSELRFVISTSAGSQTQVFQLERNTRMVEDVVVTKQ